MSDVLEELKRVSCCVFKDGWTSPDLHARVGIELAVLRGRVADLRRENQELRSALEDFMDITAPAAKPAFRDPAYGDEVEALGRRIGFGALISSASASWREVAKERGNPSGGEFVVGPCFGVLKGTREKAARALTMPDIHREQLDRPRIKPGERKGE